MVKKKVALVYGGVGGEHEVSVMSAESIRQHLDKTKYDVQDIFIDKDGKFDWELLKTVDVVFPIVHGIYGEDGCLQGLFEMVNIPYVGSRVLGSAIGMDKDVQKRLLRDAGIGIASFKVFHRGDNVSVDRFPVFVKPANTGSSVGVGKCKNNEELDKAALEAFLIDKKIVVEEFVECREIEVSVMGNRPYITSVVGEILPTHEFYDYNAKYIDPDGAKLLIPAKISEEKSDEVQKLSVKVCEVLEVRGMARVDMFLKADGGILVNEINTLPGFTKNSMYPKLWEASGISYSELLDKLIELSLIK